MERFQCEARAALALNHPHICTIHDIGEHEGRQFLVMELLEGQTLKHRIGAKSVRADELLEFGIPIADALDAAHARARVARGTPRWPAIDLSDDQKMLARYSHVRTEARRQAVAALSARPTGEWFRSDGRTGYDTKHDTNQSATDAAVMEVVEKMVGSWGLEPQASTVSWPHDYRLVP